MSKVFLALRKARQESKVDPAPNGRVADLLFNEPSIVDSGQKPPSQSREQGKKSSVPGRKIRHRGGHIDERLVAFHQANTSAAEQYRRLYVEIMRAGYTRELRTFLISSALAGEGKTFTALNLAITMAAGGEGHATLLIETDLRKPRMRKWLGTHPACGLTDYLLGDVDYAQVFYQTRIPGLTVVHAGRRVRNPTALLGSERAGGFFKEIKAQEQYRHIILDTSPVLLTTEPSALLRYVDAAILIVHARKTPRDMVTQAIEILGPENILGCVFNGITASDSYYYHYYYTSEYYQESPHG